MRRDIVDDPYVRTKPARQLPTLSGLFLTALIVVAFAVIFVSLGALAQ
jgi:hypothetical protein